MSGRIVETVADQAFLRPLPAKIQVEVTTRCNLRCAMCVKSAAGGVWGMERIPATEIGEERKAGRDQPRAA